MSAKEILHMRIDELPEAAAELVLNWMRAEWSNVAPLTPEQLAQLDRALEQDYEGRTVPHEEVVRRFETKYGRSFTKRGQ